MSYLVLARKFRPQNFDEVVGQEHISQTLKSAILRQRIAHAYLFSGPRGCGKTSIARIFAKALNCKSGPTVMPCGICENCVEISKSASVDVLEIDGASNNGIDEIRTLRENVKFVSANSKYKIYIIDEAHQITIPAFNAFLKTLEEPPDHVVFIMATTEQHKIPITILSRCQKYRFRLISNFDIASAIKNISIKENIEIEEDAVNIIISASNGSMRDALSLLDQVATSSIDKLTGKYVRELLGLLPKDIIVSITGNIAEGNIQAILNTVKEISYQGYDLLQFGRDLRNHLRHLMIYLIDPKIIEIPLEDIKVFDVQKTLFSIPCYLRMNNLLSRFIKEVRWYDQPRILLEMHLLKMAETYYDVGELISKINELKKSIEVHDKTQSILKKQHVLQDDVISIFAESSMDLISVWNDIVFEIIKKHPLTAEILKSILVEVTGASSMQFIVSTKFNYDIVFEFQEQIFKLFQEKTGLNIKMKIIVRKDVPERTFSQKDIAINEKNSQVVINHATKEDFKANMEKENTIPKYIKEIAKKFDSKAKKL
ncbi:MAG: DNA polymerase III subunit gamma/tau [Endomicrobium sp.]|jgi:DNA polymerase-3 subunit gamma/tau|nr:DNA polymerase III subunit gamma/tau [Endomicrobium sp.]